jgi:hypothetical protein
MRYGRAGRLTSKKRRFPARAAPRDDIRTPEVSPKRSNIYMMAPPRVLGDLLGDARGALGGNSLTELGDAKGSGNRLPPLVRKTPS